LIAVEWRLSKAMLKLFDAKGLGMVSFKKRVATAGVLAVNLALSACLALAPSANAEPGLSYDNDHDVIVLPDCDLAIRYNHKTFVPVKAKLITQDHVSFLKVPPEKVVKIFEDYESAGMKTAPEQILLESYDVGKIGTFAFNRFNKPFLDTARVREVQFTNERVAKETGLSETSFHAITALKSFEVVPKSGETPYYLFVMVTPPRLNIFVRKMRGTSRTFDFDPAVIVSQLRVVNTKDCIANVDLADKSASAGKDSDTKSGASKESAAQGVTAKESTAKECTAKDGVTNNAAAVNAAPAGAAAKTKPVQ